MVLEKQSKSYHSGIKIIQNTFETTKAPDLSYCKDILFEGNVQSDNLPFENQFQGCMDIIEKE